MEDKIKYSLMMLVEILVWLFFIKLAMINSDIKEHPKVRGL